MSLDMGSGVLVITASSMRTKGYTHMGLGLLLILLCVCASIGTALRPTRTVYVHERTQRTTQPAYTYWHPTTWGHR